MKRLGFAAAAASLIALGACSGNNEDALTDTETNTAVEDDLDNLSDQAADVANEAEILEDQAANLQQEAAPPADDATGAETPADENIAGM